MWKEATDWIQAGGSVLAILVAIWTVRQQANRERDNRVIDDAAFSNYIREFLSHDIGAHIKRIAAPRELNTSGRSVVALSEEALSDYRANVVERLEKLRDLPLTDWPDIEVANAFNSTYLRIKAGVDDLELNAHSALEAAAEEIRRKCEWDRGAQDRERAQIEDEDEAGEEYLGSIDDGRSVILPPRGQRGRAADQARWLRSTDEDEWESSADAKARDASHLADWEELWAQQERAMTIDALNQEVFDPLLQITADWQNTDAALCRSLNRYIARAIRYRLPTTYEGRSERPKRLAPIFR